MPLTRPAIKRIPAGVRPSAQDFDAFCQAGRNAGKPGPCPGETTIIGRAGQWLADKWKKLEGRYGRAGALAVAAGSLATFPVPGNILAIVGVAEGIRGLKGLLSPKAKRRVVKKHSETMAEAIRRFAEGDEFDFDTFAWRAFRTRSGATGAINEKGRRVYGSQATRALAAKAAPAKPAAKQAAAAPDPRVTSALKSSQDVIGRIKSGKLTFPDLVQHVDAMRKLSTPSLITVARGLGSKEPIRTKDEALGAIHDAIRVHRPLGSIRYAEEKTAVMPDKNACDCTALGEPNLVPIDDVEIFATGQYRDQPYTHADLDSVVKNFKLLSAGPNPRLTNPIVIGHEENQEWMEDTGLPSLGRVSGVWTTRRPCPTCGASGKVKDQAGAQVDCPTCFGTTQQGVLHGSFAEVPSLVAKVIKQRAYRSVSSELYDDYEDQGQHYGRTLRRVALLGGELPQVKSLKDLPALAEFGDRNQKTSIVTHTHATKAAFQGPDGKWYWPGVTKFCEGKTDCACRTCVRKFAWRKRKSAKNVDRFCQVGRNAGKPGPCPGTNVSRTIHTPPAPSRQEIVIYHRPYEAQQPATPQPAVYHAPGEAGDKLAQPEIRPATGNGPDFTKALRGLGQIASGTARLGWYGGKLAAKGLWGLTKHVLWPLTKHVVWPVAKKSMMLLGRALTMPTIVLKKSERGETNRNLAGIFGKRLISVIRMAEDRLAKHEKRTPRQWSDAQILHVGETFLRKFCSGRSVKKFCMTGENTGKPGPCPGETQSGGGRQPLIPKPGPQQSAMSNPRWRAILEARKKKPSEAAPAQDLDAAIKANRAASAQAAAILKAARKPAATPSPEPPKPATTKPVATAPVPQAQAAKPVPQPAAKAATSDAIAKAALYNAAQYQKHRGGRMKPAASTQKTIHAAPAKQQTGTVYHSPHKTPVVVRTPAIYHKPGESNTFGKPEIRHQPKGPGWNDVEKVLRGIGQVGGGALKLGLNTGKLAAKSLWGLAKHVLWPVAKTAGKIVGKTVGRALLPARKQSAMVLSRRHSEGAGREIVRVIRMAESQLATSERRRPRTWSDEQIVRVGTAVIRRFAEVQKFAWVAFKTRRGTTGARDGDKRVYGRQAQRVLAAKPAAVPAASAPAKVEPATAPKAEPKREWSAGTGLATRLLAGSKAANVVARVTKRFGRAAGSRMAWRKNKGPIKDIAIDALTGWDPAFSRSMRKKYGAIPAAIGGAIDTASTWASRLGRIGLYTLGIGLIPGLNPLVKRAAKNLTQKSLKGVFHLGNLALNKMRRGAAKVVGTIAGKTAGREAYRRMKRISQAIDRAVGKVALDIPLSAIRATGRGVIKAGRAFGRGLATAGRAIGRAGKAVWQFPRKFLGTHLLSEDIKLLANVRRVVHAMQEYTARKTGQPVVKMSDDQLFHAVYLLAA